MKKIVWAALLLALTTGVAHADRFSTVRYQCEHLNHETDGVGCGVVDEVEGPTLQIKIHVKQTDPKARRDRAKYVTGVLIQNFMALGGVWIEERVNWPNGQLMQRNCSRVKHRDFESCRAWLPVKP